MRPSTQSKCDGIAPGRLRFPASADRLLTEREVAATQNTPMQETIPYGFDLFLEPLDIREGWLYIPEIPGASNEVIPKQFEKFRIA